MDDSGENQPSPRKARRAARLRQLIKDQGGRGAQTRIAAEAGIPTSHMSHLVSGKKGIGDEIADRLEALYGYENGWMDWPEQFETARADIVQFAARSSGSIGSAVDILIAAMRGLNERDRATATMLLNAALEAPGARERREDLLAFFARRAPSVEDSGSRAASGGG